MRDIYYKIWDKELYNKKTKGKAKDRVIKDEKIFNYKFKRIIIIIRIFFLN